MKPLPQDNKVIALLLCYLSWLASEKMTSFSNKALLTKTSLVLTTLLKILLQSHATKQIYVFAAGVITTEIVY
jgi:hypothetical protein